MDMHLTDKLGMRALTPSSCLHSSRKIKSSVLLHALFGEDAFRFGGMFGAFVFLWKTAIHLLRLYNPGNKGKRRTEYWHAPVAGALCGLAILAERKRNRAGIAQQLFVR